MTRPSVGAIGHPRLLPGTERDIGTETWRRPGTSPSPVPAGAAQRADSGSCAIRTSQDVPPLAAIAAQPGRSGTAPDDRGQLRDRCLSAVRYVPDSQPVLLSGLIWQILVQPSRPTARIHPMYPAIPTSGMFVEVLPTEGWV